MAPAPAMQREAVRGAVKAILSIAAALAAVLTVAAVESAIRAGLLRLTLRLAAAGDERRQPLDVGFVGRLNRLLPRLILLRLLLLGLMRLMVLLTVLRLILLRLMVLLFARVELLRLAGRERFAGHRRLIAIPIAVAVVITVIGCLIAARIAGLRLEIGLGLPELFLRRGDQTEVMLSVLIIILSGNGVSGTLRVAGKLEIFFGDMGRRAADLYVLSVGFVHARQRILVMAATTFTVTTAHTLVVVLTVSHDLLFRQPLNLRRMDAASLHRMSVHQACSP
jgi:hypothetical protein